MPNLEIYKLSIDQDKLRQAPKKETAFYIRSMNFMTDIGISQKHLVFCITKNETNEIKVSAEHVHSSFFLRNLAGLVYEGWILIHDNFYPNRMGLNYDLKEELSALNAYFNTPNDCLIKLIRHKFSNHIDINAVEEEMVDLKKFGNLDIYITQEQGNCFYMAGELITLASLMRLTQKTDLQEAWEALFNEVALMTKRMQAFFGKFMLQFHSKYLGVQSLSDLERIVIEAPLLSEIKTPFFVVTNHKRTPKI